MQAYGRLFAEVYNRRWGGFALAAAPHLEAFLAARLGRGDRTKSLLDLCCGTGQMAGYFLSRGWVVHGVDLSPDMIEHASRNNRVAVDAGAARFLVQDAAVVDLGCTVSAAVSLYDAMNHLESLPRLAMCLGRVRGHLEPGGIFLFDLNTRAGLDRWNGMDVREDDEITLITRGVYDRTMDRAWTRISGFLKDEHGAWQPFSQTVYNTAYDLEEVRNAVLASGYRSAAITTLDALGGACLNPEAEGRVFFVCGT